VDRRICGPQLAKVIVEELQTAEPAACATGISDILYLSFVFRNILALFPRF
jgi:hypothetical protein